MIVHLPQSARLRTFVATKWRRNENEAQRRAPPQPESPECRREVAAVCDSQRRGSPGVSKTGEGTARLARLVQPKLLTLMQEEFPQDG